VDDVSPMKRLNDAVIVAVRCILSPESKGAQLGRSSDGTMRVDAELTSGRRAQRVGVELG